MKQQDIITKPRAVFKYALSFLQDKKVLDVGCNDGFYLQYFGNDSAGVDYDATAVAKGQSEGRNVQQVDLNKDSLPFPEDSFDAVYFSHVLEHLENPCFILSEIQRVLKTGGLLAILLPLENSIWNWVPGNSYFNPYFCHLFHFSPQNCRVLLNRLGLKELKIYFNLPKCHNAPFSWMMKLFQIFPLCIKKKIGKGYLIIAQKQTT